MQRFADSYPNLYIIGSGGNINKLYKLSTPQASGEEGELSVRKLSIINELLKSMTPEERANPALLNTSRKKRISKGCGIDMHNINLYIKQFEQMRMMMKGMHEMKGIFSHLGKSGGNPLGGLGGFGKGFGGGKPDFKTMKKAMSMVRKFK